ncbi:MarC family protein [Granulicella sp. 5B5]|uniref:MarC family protein n=1 Tax=Granulicella sp. 5B5 TaxID=1617967 RepID=UPI0015F65C62|nr:MarC family protein [Granulicella sp. 5B5]QMV17371.1 MarC family protein [Granulicella sp. 5B5]
MLIWTTFLIAFSALLPLINPLGSSLVFMGLVGDMPASACRTLARKIAINNVIFLAVAELLGSAILHFFGISLPIVQVSGGFVIAAIGWSVLNEPDAEASSQSKREEIQIASDTRLSTLEQKAFYPFTFPVTSGPGTLVVMLTLSARTAGKNLTHNLLAHGGLFLAVLVLSALVYLCYANAPRITNAIPPATAHGILRVMAFILLCIGVQIAWNGASVLLHSVLVR